MLKIIENFFQNNFVKPAKTIAVAVSGGADSLALTFLLHEFCIKNKIKLHAVTIDHKMRKASSKEALQLHKILLENKITHQVLTIPSKNIPQKNIEANLREERYKLLYNFCIQNKIEHLFLGHQIGDAAENFIIRLFRGSQIDGLSAMQEIVQFNKIKLCRPFINTAKDELKQYLQSKKQKWFEDETNDDEKFLRNKIRKFFEQFEEKNLIQKRIQTAAQNIFETKELLDDILLREASNCLAFESEGNFLIDIEKYKKIPPKIAQKILSLVLIEISGKDYKPRFEGLKNFEANILNLKKGQKKNFYGCMAKHAPQGSGIDKKNKITKILIYKEKLTQKPLKSLKQEISTQKPIPKKSIANADKPSSKFNFRTILGKIFS